MRMLDSVTVANLPDGADAYAGYTSGLFPTWPALQKRFHGSGAHLVSIAIDAAHHALCLDIEDKDAQPWQAPKWVEAEHARGVHRPILYASASRMHRILALLSNHGITRKQVRLWSAHYEAGKHICGPDTCKLVSVPVDGTQWRSDAPGVGGAHIDESVLRDDFFTAPPAPPPPPADLFGYLVTEAGAGNVHALTGRAVTSHDSGKTWG